MATRHRVAVLHGVNLDQLGRRDPDHYGGLSFRDLERRVDDWCRELGFQARFFQTNHEGAFVEYLHRAEGLVDAILINPGAWTHYAWSIRDALEIAGLPAVEVHLSDVARREPWRHHSVISSLCVKTITGKGPDGYREGLEALLEHLGPLDALGTASASENEEDAIAEEGTAADAEDGADAVVAAAEGGAAEGDGSATPADEGDGSATPADEGDGSASPADADDDVPAAEPVAADAAPGDAGAAPAPRD